MKRHILLFGAIFMLVSLFSHAQVYEMMYHSFEGNLTTGWTCNTSNYEFSTLSTNGSSSLKIVQTREDNVEIVFDTIDFTQNTLLRCVTLEFDHICNVPSNGSDTRIGVLYVKRIDQPGWTTLTGSYYNREEGGSRFFYNLGAFNMETYDDWSGLANPTNAHWKSERFDINNLLGNDVPDYNRKLIFRLVLFKKTTTGAATGKGWWLDNVRVRASQNQIVTPTVKMFCYPDGGDYPSSRGARVELDATTRLSQGILPDSVYLLYSVGSDTSWVRLPMAHSTTINSRYTARIPFFGYDTAMRFYCVVKDATTNHNMVTFPKTQGTWITYKCIRGKGQPSAISMDLAGPSNNNKSSDFPFSSYADNKCEFVYDSALLASAGYGAGSITELAYTMAVANVLQSRPNTQLRFRNIPTNNSRSSTNKEYTTGYFHVVFDSTLTFPEIAAGQRQTIRFQDTFYYAGKDILMQVIYNGTVDPPSASVRTIPTAANKPSLWFYDGAANYNYNPYTDESFDEATFQSTTRPGIVLKSNINQPLLYDMGISGFAYPSFDTAISDAPGERLVVKLKNYGERTANAIRITYVIDDTITGSYDWTGTLTGGQTVDVTVSSSLHLPAGYHSLCAWVEDTMTADNLAWRDHEPLNDTSCTSFIVCSGPMSGVRTVGDSNADYATIGQVLMALSRCGIDGNLTVKLADGVYPGFQMPRIDGLCDTQRVVFEPADSNVTILSSVDSSRNILVDMTKVSYVEFRNIKFVRTANAMTNMVALGSGSVGCRFIGCSFIDSVATNVASMRIESMINSGNASNLLIDSCYFEGGAIGVKLAGYSINVRSNHNKVLHSVFCNQYTNAVSATNQNNVQVCNNEMYDVRSNASYVLLAYHCYDSVQIRANKLYTTRGAGAIGVSHIYGSSTNHAVIANNMIVCDYDGSANQMTTPLNIIRADWTDVVYNTVKMNAPESGANVAAATFGGELVSNSRFLNNILVCLDEVNYAFNYIPGNQTSNIVNYNVYYAEGVVLNHKSGDTYTNLTTWMLDEPGDSNSMVLNPGFLNGSTVDLRTYNRFIKGKGLPIEEVTDDIFGTLRDATASCPGAFEFVSLFYDFEPELLLEPASEECHMPDAAEVVLQIRNSGTSPFVSGGAVSLSVACQVGNGAVQQATISTSIPSEGSATVSTGIMLSLPPNGQMDTTYSIRVWTISTSDPNQTNDTNVFSVTSRYHSAAPANVTVSVPYYTEATITPTQGINQWAVYNSATAPTRPSTLRWYTSPTSTVPFYVGETYVTEPLRLDQQYYIDQHRELPIVRITQVQLFRSSTIAGLSSPVPSWMTSSSHKVILQLTNVGDAPAYLQGDTIQLVSTTSTTSSGLNNKTFVFGAGVVIQPGESMGVVFATGTSPDPTKAVYTGSSASVGNNDNVAFIYRRGGVIEDAFAFKNITTATTTQAVRWENLNVPDYVWSSGGMPISSTSVAGFVRTAFNGDSTDWREASNDNRMFMDSVDPAWIRYIDNGCIGEMATVNVTVQAPPAVDIEVGMPQLPSGCYLTDEEVSLMLYNYGTQAVSSYTMNYTAGNGVVSENVTTPIPAGDSLYFTFNTRLNMEVPYDSLITVTVWVSNAAADTRQYNDTASATTLVFFTPAAPVTDTVVHIQYGESDTITITAPSNVLPYWYDYDGNLADSGSMYVTDVLYRDGYVNVAYRTMIPTWADPIGTGETRTGKTSFPSPYQPGKKNAKQQFIYSASELKALGLKMGPISSLQFFLDSIYWKNSSTPVDSILFNNYVISLGMTTDTIFSSRTAWVNTDTVYTRDSLVLYRSQAKSWIEHRFDTAFYWDGESSLVVQITHEDSASITTGAESRYTTKANTALYKAENSSVSPSTFAYVGNGTLSGNRANIIFEGTTYKCDGPSTPIHVILDGVPDVDAALTPIFSNDTSAAYSSCGNVAVTVVVHNMGRDTIKGFHLLYYVDAPTFDTVNGQQVIHYDTTSYTDTLTMSETDTVPLFSLPLDAGRHMIHARVAADGDTINHNDGFVGMIKVSFCEGLYYIGDATIGYSQFSEVMDTLNLVGIAGPVVFDVLPGVYNEKVLVGEILGASAVNTLTFRGHGDSTIIRAATANGSNYVFRIEGSSNIILDSLTILSRPASGNYGHVLTISDASNVTIRNCTIKAKGTISNNNASNIILGGIVSNLKVENCVIDSGYYSVAMDGTTGSYSNLAFQNNIITNFNDRGLNLSNVSRLEIKKNTIRASNSKAVTGIFLSGVTGKIEIVKNNIVLSDASTSGKRGIQLENVQGSAAQWGRIFNNMISCHHGGNSVGRVPSGLYIDVNSAYLNIYFNTIRIDAPGTASANNTKNSNAFYAGTGTNHLNVMNNIFANFGAGYAYSVSATTNVANSNYNAYFSNGLNMAKWGTDMVDLAALQTANQKDGSSMQEEPYFQSEEDLHLAMTNFVEKAQYNPDVTDDIDDSIRSQIPPPTIGAHEMHKLLCDMSIVRVDSPTMPKDKKNPNNIEGDSILVKVSIYNNGNLPSDVVGWQAYLVGYHDTTEAHITESELRNLGTFAVDELKIDSVLLPTVMGVIDTQMVIIKLFVDCDSNLVDNEKRLPVYLAAAYDLEVSGMVVADGNPGGCKRHNNQISIKLKNVGKKPFRVGDSIKIGYHTQGYYPSYNSNNINANKISIPTMVDTVEEYCVVDANWPVSNNERTFVFNTRANLYPTDTMLNIKVRVSGWCNYQYDVVQSNDSTTKNTEKSVDAFFTPLAPVGINDTVDYGTTAEVHVERITQTAFQFPVRWYRDSTQSGDPYFYMDNNYNKSLVWSRTPRFFHDSTYYLRCVSNKSCTSAYSMVSVHVLPPVANDMGVDSLLAPLGSRVYMENDTVRLRIVNYGNQPQTNIPVCYQLKKGNQVVQMITDTCRQTIPAGESYIFTFDTLLLITTPTTEQEYKLIVWTDLPNDEIIRNDTLRMPYRGHNEEPGFEYKFKSLSYSTEYCSPSFGDAGSIDICRVSFNEIDFTIPGLGRTHTVLGEYPNNLNVEVPTLHVTRGMSDSIIVELANLGDPSQRLSGDVSVFIDFNRNGKFELRERVVAPTSVQANSAPMAALISIPFTASYGYMKMRVMMLPDGATEPESLGCPVGGSGHVIDFLLFVDAEAPSTDLAFTQIVSPRNYLITNDDSVSVKYRISNKGSRPITSFNVHFRFACDDSVSTISGTIPWTGILQAGGSAVLTLPKHQFAYGTTALTIWHDLNGDADSTNDLIEYEYHRFHIVRLIMNDNFDSLNHWYAPRGYNNFDRNVWECGTPSKAAFAQAYSEPNAWVTDLVRPITTGKRGNVSYLYSPIIDISQIRPDTLSFRLFRSFGPGSSLHVEYYNFEGDWVKLRLDSLTNFYNNTLDEIFDQSSTGYTAHWIRTAQGGLSGDFPELLQFRFVYQAPQGTSASTSYGDGCAIDNFRIGRARRPVDVGVVDITEPTAPRYGETFYPKMVVKNYGTDTIRSLSVGYTHYGTNLAKVSNFTCAIAPDEMDTLTMTTSFTVTSDFPAEFDITAFTISPLDIYWDNDTASRSFTMAPLEHDISAEDFLQPLTNVIAGDTGVTVTMRIRNFGIAGIERAVAYCDFNGRDFAREEIDFMEALGEPLGSMEFYNYTFKHKFLASMGMMNLTAYIKCDSNDYIYNDTITKRIYGISSIMDVAAASVVVDTSDHNVVRVQLVIENRGARGANNFKVGFWYDNDTSTLYTETYTRYLPLPALSTGFHLFDTTLPKRTAPYSYVCAFVNIDKDNDRTNDTTCDRTIQFIDIRADRLIVEENANPDCRVFIQLTNIGNLSLVGKILQLRGTINGTNLSLNVERRIDPEQTIVIEFPQKVDKDPMRQYVGTGKLILVVDGNENNQTSVVDVVNYWEDAPLVQPENFVLEQNYPNPFTHQTTIPFSLPNPADVHLFVMDATGRIVFRNDRHFQSGHQTFTVDMDRYPAGVYYYGIEVDGNRQMRKMILQ